MSGPPEGSKTTESNHICNPAVNLTIANVIDAHVVAVTKLFTAFNQDSNGLLNGQQAIKLAKTLVLFDQCSDKFFERHRQLIDLEHRNACPDPACVAKRNQTHN